MNLLVAVFCVLNCLQSSSEASKILAIFPFPARSHYAAFEPLLKRLSERGHELTVISHFPQKKAIPNFTDVDVSTSFPTSRGAKPFPLAKDVSVFASAMFLWKFAGPKVCKGILGHPRVKEIVEGDEKFDLVISEVFTGDCYLGFVHKFGVPYVGVSSCTTVPWLPDILGNPDNPSYIPQIFSRSSDRMSYPERFLNAVYLLGLKFGYRIFSDKSSYEIAKDHFGPDIPSIDHLRSHLGLVLVYGHHSVTSPRALAPGVKEVGGMHIPISGPDALPGDLRKYLDSATEGVVYFSAGSLLNSSTLSKKNLAIYRQAFAELPQRVLWKCNEKEIQELPENVKCLDWTPQLSVLCHPNVRVFMSHGGLLGMQEAVYCGVPVLGMPVFGDQFGNVAFAVERGYALRMDYHDSSYEELSRNLEKLITDTGFSQRAREASRRFRDRPQAPLDEAVFWVEYVLRHGPEALRTAASELAWWQYLLLDVVGGVFVFLFAVFWILRRLVGVILRGVKNRGGTGKRKRN